MTQAYRRTGSRDNNPRYPRERLQAAPDRQNKPYKTGVPPRDSIQIASILKTRAFKLLVNAVGTENIALALDSNLGRVTELENGEGFTPETAFHMETTLGLPDGFFDQPNPVLTPEIIARLKSPLAIWGESADVARTDEDIDRLVVVDQTTVHGSPENESPAELEMLKNKRANAGQNTATAVAERKTVSAEKAPSTESKGLRQSGSSQSPSVNEARVLAEIRRVNLHTLTKRKGSKAQLGRLLKLSESNMAHRLHGQKRMDDIEAQRFTDKLGLPTGWLDIPRESTDVPEAVADLLSPPSRRPSALPDDVHLNTKPTVRASSNAALTEKSTSGTRVSPAATDDLPLSAVTLPEPVSELPSELTANHDQRLKPTLGDGSISSAVSDLSDVYRSASATNLETLRGIAPIAEALIKTLAGKARTGRLDEIRALQFLQQAVLL